MNCRLLRALFVGYYCIYDLQSLCYKRALQKRKKDILERASYFITKKFYSGNLFVFCFFHENSSFVGPLTTECIPDK